MTHVEFATHTPLHGIKVSRCKKPWDTLEHESDGVRICKHCNSKVVRVSGMTEQELDYFLREHTQSEQSQPIIRRRMDGTLILSSRSARRFHPIHAFLVSSIAQLVVAIPYLTKDWPAFMYWLLPGVGIVGFALAASGLLYRNKSRTGFAVVALLVPNIVLFFTRYMIRYCSRDW